MKKEKKKNKKSNIFITLFIITLLIIALVAVVYNDFTQVLNNKKEMQQLKSKYVELKDEEESLNVEVAKLEDPDYIARYAREKYMFSKEGEVILRIVDPKKEEKEE